MAQARFTLRTLLVILSGAAVIAMLGGPAYGGRAGAIGVTVAVASVLAALAIQAGFYLVAMACLRMLGAEDVIARTSRGGVQRNPSVPTSESSSAPTGS